MDCQDTDDSSEEELQEMVAGAGLAQVFAVSVERKTTDGAKKCEVYGTISVLDADGALHIYQRGPNDPECVDQGGKLSLAEVERTVRANKGFSIRFDLKDGSAAFIKTEIKVHLQSNQVYDRLIVEDVSGEGINAKVYLSVLRVAVPGAINAYYLSERKGDVVVYGRIVACYGKRFSYGEDDAVKDYCSFVLFERKEGEGAVLGGGDDNGRTYFHPLGLCVAMPAYSSIVIEADLHFLYPGGRGGDTIKRVEEVSVDEVFLNRIRFVTEYGTFVVYLFGLDACRA